MDFDEPIPVEPEITAETDIIAIGGAITAETILESYRGGVFPMGITAEVDGEYPVEVNAWFAPAQRAVLRYPGMTPSRSLRRSMRGFEVSFDTDFAAVVEGCADPIRPSSWINAEYRQAYSELHHRGIAHSVEVWSHGNLAGGLIGVEVGGLFCADSKFHRVRDASKAAVAALSARIFGADRGAERMIDAQWLTPHLASLGFTQMPQADYQSALPGLLALPPAFDRPGGLGSTTS